MMEVDKKKTRTDEAWVRLYARFETDCLLPADAEHAPAMHRRLYLKWGSVAAAVIAGIVCFAAWWAVPEQGGDSRSLLTEENRGEAPHWSRPLKTVRWYIWRRKAR